MQHSHEALDPIGGYSRVRLLAPLRHRDFRLLWSGMCISLLGDGIFMVAMAWQVYELSNVPTALSVVSIAMTIPWIVCLLLGGVVSDRFDRRRVILGPTSRAASRLPPLPSCRSPGCSSSGT
jgi:DHA3 family tetracycline resistance protein-like MFS transporter